MMKVIQTIARFDKLHGGIATCTYDLISALHKLNHPVDLMTIDSDDLMGNNEDWIKVLKRDSITPIEYSPNMFRFLRDSNYDIYHTNGLWLYCNHITCSIARHKNKPYILSTHGMLYPDALRRSYWKKWPTLTLFFRTDINKANCIHATCTAEMEHIRSFGYKGPIAIIPNPANLPDYLDTIAINKPNIMGCSPLRKFGFLGRLHPIKKIENLLYGMQLLSEKNCELVIIGQGEPSYEAFLKDEVQRLGLKNVSFKGFLSGKEKYEELAKLSCLFVPSDFENFGMIVTEALSVGTPVMASLGTPWEELNIRKCGWWIDRTPEHITSVMKQILDMPLDELLSMGQRGRQLVKEKYTDIQVALKMAQLYTWLINGENTPNFINTLK